MTTVLRPYVWDYPGEQVPEETFTHSHLSWSSTILYQLHPSAVIHSILPIQFTWLTVFLHNCSPSPLWYTSCSGTLYFILHTCLHPISAFFHNTSHTVTICFAVVPRLSSIPSLSQLFTWTPIFYLNVTHPSDHSHLCPLRCHLIFFPYRPGLTSMQHTNMHTTAVQSLSLIQQHPFNSHLSRTTQVSQYQKCKTNLDLLVQDTVSGSGIIWAICKSAPHPTTQFLQAGCHSCHPTNSVKALKARYDIYPYWSEMVSIA